MVLIIKGSGGAKPPSTDVVSTNPNGSNNKLPGNVIHFKPPDTGKVSSPEDWRDEWELSRGKPVNNLANALIAMRNDPILKEAFAFKEMNRVTEVCGPLPGSPDEPASFLPRPLKDVDVSKVQEYLQKLGLSQIGPPTAHHHRNARS
jgi:hypothetical protein